MKRQQTQEQSENTHRSYIRQQHHILMLLEQTFRYEFRGIIQGARDYIRKVFIGLIRYSGQGYLQGLDTKRYLQTRTKRYLRRKKKTQRLVSGFLARLSLGKGQQGKGQQARQRDEKVYRLWEQPGPKLCALLEQMRGARERAHRGFPWLRSLRPPMIHLGTPQKALFHGHTRMVNCVAWSPDGSVFADIGMKSIAWRGRRMKPGSSVDLMTKLCGYGTLPQAKKCVVCTDIKIEFRAWRGRRMEPALSLGVAARCGFGTRVRGGNCFAFVTMMITSGV
jgi:hypothetical protein